METLRSTLAQYARVIRTIRKTAPLKAGNVHWGLLSKWNSFNSTAAQNLTSLMLGTITKWSGSRVCDRCLHCPVLRFGNRDMQGNLNTPISSMSTWLTRPDTRHVKDALLKTAVSCYAATPQPLLCTCVYISLSGIRSDGRRNSGSQIASRAMG